MQSICTAHAIIQIMFRLCRVAEAAGRFVAAVIIVRPRQLYCHLSFAANCAWFSRTVKTNKQKWQRKHIDKSPPKRERWPTELLNESRNWNTKSKTVEQKANPTAPTVAYVNVTAVRGGGAVPSAALAALSRDSGPPPPIAPATTKGHRRGRRKCPLATFTRHRPPPARRNAQSRICSSSGRSVSNRQRTPSPSPSKAVVCATTLNNYTLIYYRTTALYWIAKKRRVRVRWTQFFGYYLIESGDIVATRSVRFCTRATKPATVHPVCVCRAFAFFARPVNRKPFRLNQSSSFISWFLVRVLFSFGTRAWRRFRRRFLGNAPPPLFDAPRRRVAPPCIGRHFVLCFLSASRRPFSVHSIITSSTFGVASPSPEPAYPSHNLT